MFKECNICHLIKPITDFYREIAMKDGYRKTRFGEVPIILFNWSNCWLVQKWAQIGWGKVLESALLATNKWPHLKDEILEDLASNEDLVGKELHDKYWTRT